MVPKEDVWDDPLDCRKIVRNSVYNFKYVEAFFMM